MEYFNFVRKYTSKHPYLSFLGAFASIFFFVPSMMTAASTVVNLLGIGLFITAVFVIATIIYHIFTLIHGDQ